MTPPPMDPNLLIAWGTITAAIAGVGGWLISPWHKRVREQRRRSRDADNIVLGYPARQGIPKQPGVLEILAALCQRLENQDLTLDRLDRRTGSPLLNGQGEQLLGLIPTVERLDRLTDRLDQTLTEHLELHTAITHAKANRRRTHDGDHDG